LDWLSPAVTGLEFILKVLGKRREAAPEELPYNVVEPKDLLTHLRVSLGVKQTAYVTRPETAALHADPGANRFVLLIGQSASGKTRDSAELAMALAETIGPRARVYLMKRPEVPRKPDPDIREQVPILFFDDLDQPWRSDTRADVKRATDIFRRVSEIAPWYAKSGNDGRCWVIANARVEPFDRVCEVDPCREAAARFEQVRLGAVEGDLEIRYWRSALKAFGLQAADEIVETLAQENAGGFRLPYVFAERVANSGRKRLKPGDIDDFKRLRTQTWGAQTEGLSDRQRRLMEAMGALDRVGVPLYGELVLDLCLNRDLRQYAGGNLRRRWESGWLDRDLRILTRRHFALSPEGVVTVHASRLPEQPENGFEALAVEVGNVLVDRARRADLAPTDVAHLRDALAAMDETLYGTDLLPLLCLANKARGALSQPSPRLRKNEIDEVRAHIGDLPEALREEDGHRWAVGQRWLGVAYNQLPVGDFVRNNERAIDCFRSALRVHTEEAYPQDWAAAQNDLGLAYRNLPASDPREGLRMAIDCYSKALRVLTEEGSPEQWAAAHSNLGVALAETATGEQGENLRQAIGCYGKALRVYSEEAFPEGWAATQNNLAIAYARLPTTDPSEGIRRAIAYWRPVLRVYTRRAFPYHWALIQRNLGNAYRDLHTGDRGENLRRAVDCYVKALRVFTEESFPTDWAATKHSLATAYTELPARDRGPHLRKAIDCCEAALRVWTRTAFPRDWAMAQAGLAAAYLRLQLGDRGENTRRAIGHYKASLQVYTEDAFPHDWAMAQSNLGVAFRNLPSGDPDEALRCAFECFWASLRVQTEESCPSDWAMTQNNLGNAYGDLRTGDHGENLRKAIACYSAALRVYTEDAFPQNWALTQENLGIAFRDEDMPGDRCGNLQKAIEHYENALEVLTEEAYPHSHPKAARGLALAREAYESECGGGEDD